MQQKFGVLEISIVVAIMYLALTTLWDLVQRRIERIFRSRLWRRCDETARARRPLSAITIWAEFGPTAVTPYRRT